MSRFKPWHNPVPGAEALRIDQGVDYNLSSKGFNAPFRCKVLRSDAFTTGWEGGWLVCEIMFGPFTGQGFYVAEGCLPVVSVGHVVPHGGVQIAKPAPNHFFNPPLVGNIEAGWVAPNLSMSLARTLPGYSGDQSIQAITCGAAWNLFVEQCGGPSGHNNTSLAPDWSLLPSALRRALGV